MANSIPTYTKIPIPFANSGDKNSIPQNATGNNLASYSEGFPPITSQPITENGIPPEREDFNGLGFSTTNNISYLQQGGLYTFDTQLSSAIGGYAQGAILAYINNGQLYYLRSKINNNTYNFNTNSSYIGQYWEYAFGQGNTGGFSIGSIFAYPSALPPEGAYLLNGQTITNCQTLYADFWNWLNDGVTNNYIRTLTNSAYEAEIAEYGMCGAFVVDTEAGSVRLPNLTNAFIQGADSSTIGQTVGAGLPNIDGSFQGGRSSGSTSYIEPTGAFARSGNYDSYSSNGNSDMYDISFNASLSNPIYGNSNTVQPPAIRVSWCIQVFNAATELSTQESAQLASQMQMKAQKDLANVNANIDFVVESWNDENGNWYRVYRSGWCEQGGIALGATNKTGNVITLFRSYIDKNYNLQASVNRDDTVLANGAPLTVVVFNKTNTNFNASTMYGGSGYAFEVYNFSWEAKGYIA